MSNDNRPQPIIPTKPFTALPIAVVFDWDNTLVDSWDAIAFAMNGSLKHFGLRTWSLEEVKDRCKLAAKDYFPAIFGVDWEKARDVYYQHFNLARLEHAAKPRSGAGDLLRWLQDRKVPLFVVSNKRGDYLRQESAALDWDRFFVAVIGATDTPESKPHRAPVDHALATHGLKANSDVWFVGDTDVDMQCARNAGCTPIFIGDPSAPEALSIEFTFAGCDKFIEALEAI